MPNLRPENDDARDTITEYEARQIADALNQARQNTVKGQFYSQAVSVFGFVLFVCSITSYTLLILFNTFGDKTIKIRTFPFGSDFYVDIGELLLPHERSAVQPKLTNHWHTHDFRHDFYACDEIVPLETSYYISYKFNYNYKLVKGISFTLPPHFMPENVYLDLKFDKTQEIVLMDQLCLSGTNFERCFKVYELIGLNLNYYIKCDSNRPCQFDMKLVTIHYSLFNVYVHVNITEARYDHTDCYYMQTLPYDLSDKQYLLVKSNLNIYLLREAPDLYIQHQSSNLLIAYRTGCISSGILIMLLIIILYRQSMRRWEQNIRQTTLQEIRNKQKVYSHIDKIKQAMRHDKGK